MKKYLVKDIMVPISEYATVSEGASLYEAVVELEKAQEAYQQSQYSHRAVLVLNKEGQVIGKISQMDFLYAIEPKDASLDKIRENQRFGFTRKAVALQQEEYLKSSPPITDVYSMVSNMNVNDYMQKPTEGEYVDENASLEMARHQLTAGSNLSLLVTRGEGIVGILRLSDVFAAFFHAMKKSEPQRKKEAGK